MLQSTSGLKVYNSIFSLIFFRELSCTAQVSWHQQTSIVMFSKRSEKGDINSEKNAVNCCHSVQVLSVWRKHHLIRPGEHQQVSVEVLSGFPLLFCTLFGVLYFQLAEKYLQQCHIWTLLAWRSVSSGNIMWVFSWLLTPKVTIFLSSDKMEKVLANFLFWTVRELKNLPNHPDCGRTKYDNAEVDVSLDFVGLLYTCGVIRLKKKIGFLTS